MNDLKLLTSFTKYLLPYKARVLYAILSIPFSTVCHVAFPWLIIKIFDDFIIPKESEGLTQCIILIVSVLIINIISDSIYNYCIQTAAFEALTDMRRHLFSHILQLPRKYFDKQPIGVVLSRLTSDFEALSESFAAGILGLFTDSIKIIVLLIFLFSMSFKLTLTIIVVIPLLAFTMKILKDKLRDAYNQARVHLAISTGYLQECLSGIKTIQLFSAQNKTLSKYSLQTHDFFKAQKKSNSIDALLFSIIEGVTYVCVGAILWVGADLLGEEAITIGIIIGFINTLQKIFIPIREFTQQLTVIQRALAALQHIYALFNEEVEKESHQDMNIQSIDSIEFENVSFKYHPDNPHVLRNVSFKLNKGDKLAIVGSTGSGKSTLIRLITRAYDHYEGSIKINDIELSTISKLDINRLTSVMQQDVHLFNETIAFNISLGRKHLNKEKIKQAAEYVYADTFIKKLEQGYESEVLSNGSNLSAGEAQLISFARTIALNQELIILDEATSTVDSVTEEIIQKAMVNVFMGRSVIAIAHRLSTVQHSDLILVLNHGQIVERGKHDELMKKGGMYYNLIQKMKHED